MSGSRSNGTYIEINAQYSLSVSILASAAWCCSSTTGIRSSVLDAAQRKRIPCSVLRSRAVVVTRDLMALTSMRKFGCNLQRDRCPGRWWSPRSARRC